MKVTKKELPKNQVELTIEIEEKEYQKFIEKTAEVMAKESKIPGFRPGKAPYEIVKQKFGENAILQNAMDDILTHFYFEAVIQEKLEPISHPKVDIEKLAPQNPIIFKATINILPEIKLADLDKIEIKKKKAKIENSEIEKAIETMRDFEAKETISDKPAKIGDKVEVDFVVKMGDVVIEGGTEKNYPLILGKGQMIPGFEEQIVGHKKGDEFKFKLSFPKEYHNKGIAGKEADFELKLNSVFERELPEVNDEWAKRLQAKDLKDLKEKIKENYQVEEEAKIQKETEMEMLNKIIENSEIGEFSDEIVAQEAEKMIEELKHEIGHRGIEFSDYITKLGKKIEEIQKEFMPQAKKRLESSLVIRKVIDDQKFEIKDDELKSEIEKAKMMYGNENENVKKQLESDHYKNYLINTLLNKKVMEYLTEKIIHDDVEK